MHAKTSQKHHIAKEILPAFSWGEVEGGIKVEVENNFLGGEVITISVGRPKTNACKWSPKAPLMPPSMYLHKHVRHHKAAHQCI